MLTLFQIKHPKLSKMLAQIILETEPLVNKKKELTKARKTVIKSFRVRTDCLRMTN